MAASTSPWAGSLVFKFGGTSMSELERVARVVAGEQARLGSGARVAVVASALGGVTNDLIRLAEVAAGGDRAAAAAGEDALCQRHLGLAKRLLDDDGAYRAAVLADFEALRAVLTTLALQRRIPEDTLELISGFGEIWSSRLLAAYLQQGLGIASAWCNAREVLFVRTAAAASAQNRVQVDWERSQAALDRWAGTPVAGAASVAVFTGFIATDAGDGAPTTLKRNGSDFSATIIGALLRASSVTIWKDVDGVFSADPRRVPQARMLDLISYREATELAHFGAKVVHPSTMQPAIEHAIPVLIRNTFNTDSAGTRICAQPTDASQRPVRGFSTIADVALVFVQGKENSDLEFSSLAHSLFRALSDADVKVILATQSCFEHMFRFGVSNEQADAAEAALTNTLYREIHLGKVFGVKVHRGCSVVTAVGDGIRDTPGVAASFFAGIAKARANVIMVGGSAERSLSAVVDADDVDAVLGKLHEEFRVK